MELDIERIRTERCAAAFDSMFWAFLFFLDVRIGVNGLKVDVLPNFVGWWIIATALTRILDLAPVVRTLRTLSYWLLGLSLFNLVQFERHAPRPPGFHVSLAPLWLLGLAGLVLGIMFVWQLCGLIMAMASAVGDRTIYEKAELRRKLYIAVPVFLFGPLILAMVCAPMALIALFVGLPLAIIVFCLMMGLMRGTAQMCRGRVPLVPRDRWPEPPSDRP